MDEVLSQMAKGEKNRDATTKIRGFIFQDYYTIELLLDQNITEIYTEYIEDIVYIKDGKYNCVQAKYTEGNGTTNVEKGIESLYYQYLKADYINEEKWEFELLTTNDISVDKTKLYANDNCCGSIDIDKLDDIKTVYRNAAEPLIALRKQYVFENLSTAKVKNDFDVQIVIRPVGHASTFDAKLKSYYTELLEKIKNNVDADLADKTLFGLCLCYVHKNCYLRGEKSSISNKGLMSFIESCINKYSDKEIILSCIKMAYNEMIGVYLKKNENCEYLNIIHDKLYDYFNIQIEKEEFEIALKHNFYLRKDDSKAVMHAYNTIVEYFKKMHKFFVSCLSQSIIPEDDIMFDEIFRVENDVLILRVENNSLESVFLSTPDSSNEMEFTKNICVHLVENENYLPIWHYQDSEKNSHYAYYSLDFCGVMEDVMHPKLDITRSKINKAFFVHCLKCCSVQEHKLCDYSEFQREMLECKCKNDVVKRR